MIFVIKGKHLVRSTKNRADIQGEHPVTVIQEPAQEINITLSWGSFGVKGDGVVNETVIRSSEPLL
jgi:hypothetical protein